MKTKLSFYTKPPCYISANTRRKLCHWYSLFFSNCWRNNFPCMPVNTYCIKWSYNGICRHTKLLTCTTYGGQQFQHVYIYMLTKWDKVKQLHQSGSGSGTAWYRNSTSSTKYLTIIGTACIAGTAGTACRTEIHRWQHNQRK
jgi:hypothetical protein